MKKSLIALALAGAFSGAVHAQSAIEIYGIVDMGFVRETGTVGTSPAIGSKLQSGVQSGSRIGFKGTEDLGGGLKGLFVLETGIQVDVGSSVGNGFSRQSFVGVQGDFGTVTLGRQYTPYFLTMFSVADPFAAGMAGAAQNLLLPGGAIEADRAIRMNNAIKYTTPVFGGFTGEIAYGFGELAVDSGARRVISGSVGYSQKPVNARLAYYRKNNDTDTDSIESVMLAANVDFGVAKVFSAITDNDWLTVGGKSRDYLIGASMPMGPHTFIASYIKKDGRGADAARDADQWALGYTYALSKRTNAYAAYGRISNDGTAAYTVGNNSEAGFGDKAFNIGIRHLF